MGTPRPRSPSPPPPLLKLTTPPLPPPPPPPLSSSLSRDFSFSLGSSLSLYVSSQASPLPPTARAPGQVHLRTLPLRATADMSRAPLGRVGSDLNYNNYAKANYRHQDTSHSSGSSNDRNAPFFSGIGGARRGESRDGTVASKAEEKMRKGKRAIDMGQWVKKYMTSLVEQLRASFSRHGERERRGQRRRPYSFSGNGPAATRERERWRQRRGQLSSAPASLRASPANSGHLSVGGSVKLSTSSEESTMEELQSAIQAAIAHCKNSIAAAK